MANRSHHHSNKPRSDNRRKTPNTAAKKSSPPHRNHWRDHYTRKPGPRPITPSPPPTQLKNDVFIVHGHDNAMRDAVASYIRKLGLNAIILSEEPSGGKTLIEKLETYRNVHYAVVLLSPDDSGYPNDCCN